MFLQHLTEENVASKMAECLSSCILNDHHNQILGGSFNDGKQETLKLD
jgi:hypothetical protein